MDPMSLAALAAPVVVKVAEAFSKAAGDKLGGKIDQLSLAVINKSKVILMPNRLCLVLRRSPIK